MEKENFSAMKELESQYNSCKRVSMVYGIAIWLLAIGIWYTSSNWITGVGILIAGFILDAILGFNRRAKKAEQAYLQAKASQEVIMQGLKDKEPIQ